ncbi:MAG: NAD dependent epimerase/dehydratase family enzyme [Rickettsiales bacterium]|jgi:NAD dependent epimerase/dehydratase family enzyme
MQNQNILFLGQGYVAQYFCQSYHLDSFLNLSASINTSKEKYFKTPSTVETINFSQIDGSILDNYDNFVISIPPLRELKTDVVIDKFHDYFSNRKTPYKLIYLSATSVYGDHEGAKVQEDSPLKSTFIGGLARIGCESWYQKLQKNQSANIIILRLAAIYGEKRNSILAIRNGKITHNKPSNRIISRTHIADITAIIREIILSTKIKNHIFNITDNHSCPTSEVNDYICEEILKIDKLPIENDVEEFNNSALATDNKIVDNGKIKKILSYEFVFPSYKEGLKQIAKGLNPNS